MTSLAGTWYAPIARRDDGQHDEREPEATDHERGRDGRDASSPVGSASGTGASTGASGVRVACSSRTSVTSPAASDP